MKFVLTALALVVASGAQAESCGWISDFDVSPRSKELYEAKILQIDGSTPRTSVTRNYRVTAGRHELLVAERIDRKDLPLNAQLRRDRYHTIIVDVEPNKRYFVAAQFNHDQRFDATGGYWEPSVWRTRDEACR